MNTAVQPWVIDESISGDPVTLEVVGLPLDHFQQVTLNVTNTSKHPWTAFQVELQRNLGVPSGYDGVSFGDICLEFSPVGCLKFGGVAGPPFSTKFARLQFENINRDVLLFSDGVVNPGEAVSFHFFLDDWLLGLFQQSFFLVQRPLLVVETDLKPKGDPNCINPASKGSEAVAVFGGVTQLVGTVVPMAFDAASIEPSTLKFGGASPLSCALDDVPVSRAKSFIKDDVPDLLCHFATAQTAWPAPGTDCGPVALTGSLKDGTPILGVDTACLAGEPTCKSGDPAPIETQLAINQIPPPPVQRLTFSQVTPIEIRGPGSTAGPVPVTAGSSSLTINSISIPYTNTSNGKTWLSASVSGRNTFNLFVANTGDLPLGASYDGYVTVRANGDPTTDSVLRISLRVGSRLGLSVNPSLWSVTRIGPVLAPEAQTFIVTNQDGLVVPVFGQFVPDVAIQPFATVQNPFQPGNVTLLLSLAITTNGIYTGKLRLFNVYFGEISVPVTLTIKPATFSQNPVSFSIPAGGSAAPQTVDISVNGKPVTVVAVVCSTSSGGNWLIASKSATAGQVTVEISASSLGPGTYSGTVTVSTAQGLTSIQVNLTVT